MNLRASFFFSFSNCHCTSFEHLVWCYYLSCSGVYTESDTFHARTLLASQGDQKDCNLKGRSSEAKQEKGQQ